MLRPWIFLALLTLGSRSFGFGWNPDLDAREHFPDDVGFVAVQLVSNVEIDWLNFRGWTRLGVERIDGKSKSYTLPVRHEGLSSGQIFIGALPAGEYRMTEFWGRVMQVGEESEYKVSVPESLGKFRVEAGRFSDAGALVFHFLPDSERKRVWLQWQTTGVMVRVPALPPLHPWFGAAFPRLAEVPAAEHALEPIPESGFDATGIAATKLELPPALRDAAITGRPRRLADGQLALPGQLGQLWLRKGDAHWTSIDTPYSTEINDVLAIDGSLLIVGDRGLLARRSADGAEWVDEKRMPANYVLHWIERLEDGQIYVLASSQTRAMLLRVSVTDLSWQELASFGREEGFEPADLRPDGIFVSLNEYRQLTTSPLPTRLNVLGSDHGGIRLAIGAKRWRFRFEGGQVEAMDSGQPLITAFQQPNGYLFGLSGKQEDAVYSLDGGSSWLKVQRPQRTHIGGQLSEICPPYVVDKNRVMLVGPKLTRDSRKRIKASSQPYLLESTKPKDRFSWKALRVMPATCYELLSGISTDQALFLRCRNQAILRSADQGEHWHIDRHPSAGDQPIVNQKTL